MRRTWKETFILIRNIEGEHIKSIRAMEFPGEYLNNLAEVYESLAGVNLEIYDDDFIGYMNFYCDLSRDTLTMSCNAKLILIAIMQPITREVFG